MTLAETLTIAEAVTGLDPITLAKASRLELLDSTLHAPQAGFGEEDLYPDVEQKAAVLAVRIARNHPLPDGNKRLAWQSRTIFLTLNGYDLVATAPWRTPRESILPALQRQPGSRMSGSESCRSNAGRAAVSSWGSSSNAGWARRQRSATMWQACERRWRDDHRIR